MSDTPTFGFGVNIVGKQFTWYDESDDGEQVEHTFRSRGGITFDEVLEYRAIQAELQMDGQLLVKTLQRRADFLDGEEAEKRPIDEIRDELHQLSADSQEQERRRWGRIIDQTLILVNPPDRDRLRPMLERGDYTAVTDLRDWLIGEVITRTEKTVEAVGEVDPTLPPPPPDSADSTDGGGDSEDEESASTD